MKNRPFVAFLAALSFCVAAAPLSAHHGAANFDNEKKLTMKATVTEWFWANPHCFLKFDVQDDKGAVVHWIAETSNPSDMSNLGWNKLTFKPGDQATVTIEPAKNGQPIGRIMQVVLASGQTLGTRPAGITGVPPVPAKSADSPK
jgi:hypothetical protein